MLQMVQKKTSLAAKKTLFCLINIAINFDYDRSAVHAKD